MEPLNYIQRVTLDHAKRYSDVTPEEHAEKLISYLHDTFGISRIVAIQLLNIWPEKEVDVRAILGDKLTQKEVEGILELLEKEKIEEEE
ncbi:MAG: hypothetical protein ACFFCQ_03225 [Promethearchaeota archaeon]